MQKDSTNGCSGEDEHPDQICCLFDNTTRCRRPAGNASYSKRIQKIVTQKRLRLQLDPAAPHIYICDLHKAMIQSARAKRKRKDSEDDSNGTDNEYPEVDLALLQVNTLRRYKRHFKIPTRPNMNKHQLSDILQKHFKSMVVFDKEKDILSSFFQIVRNNGNKLDQKANNESN